MKSFHLARTGRSFRLEDDDAGPDTPPDSSFRLSRTMRSFRMEREDGPEGPSHLRITERRARRIVQFVLLVWQLLLAGNPPVLSVYLAMAGVGVDLLVYNPKEGWKRPADWVYVAVRVGLAMSALL